MCMEPLQGWQQLRNFGFKITYITGWRAYLGNSQHNYAHWTKIQLPEGRHDPGVLPFEVYAQAPLRLTPWCSFELDHRARTLVRELAVLCETPTTSIAALIERIQQRQANIHTETAVQYLAKPATPRAQMPSYTMKLPMAIYMLDYYLPMLSPNDGYNETGLTMQSAGPVREEWQPIHMSHLSRVRVPTLESFRRTGCLSFRHPSLAQTDVRQLLESEAHHHKVCPIGTGRLIALVGVSSTENATTGMLSVMFGLVLGITPRTSKNKNELPTARIHRQCNPKTLEVAFLTEPATEFFAVAQLQVLQERYLACGQGLSHAVPTTAANTTFLLRDMWMFGITKSTSELTAVAQTPECRYHLGLGINNVQVAVNGMDGDKKSHLLSLCGQLLKLVLTPCHIETEASQWIRTTAVSYAAEMDGHVLGTLCAVTMALLTNRLDLCIQGLFGAGKSKSMAILILALLELDVDHRLRILFLCKENSGTRSFADLLQWLDPPVAVLRRLGRLVGDQERNKASYSYTRFDINPRERRQMLAQCQLVMATGGTVSQDLTMQWSTIGSFMQDVSLMIIDEGQQYGTDREIATISLLRTQPLILWTGDAQQTPGGLARAAPNAKRSRQLLLAKQHGLRSNRKYFMPSNLAEAMAKLLNNTSNEGLQVVKGILDRGAHVLGNVWTNQLLDQDATDLNAINTVLPGLPAQFRTATPQEVAQLPRIVDPQLLKGATVNFSRSMIRLAWLLQHVETLLPMAGEIQAELNCHTAGVSDAHAWGLMLPSSSRVSPVTYHSVVAVRYPDLCGEINHLWELGSFASGGIPDRPPGFQFVLWDTEAKINGLVAADLNTLVAHVIRDLQDSTNFSDGLFVMTTATDHKNNLNRSTIKKNFSRALRVETIANSAGGTAAVAIVAQPSTGFLNGHFYADGSPTEDTEDCLGRITVGLTRSKSLTIVVSPLDMKVYAGAHRLGIGRTSIMTHNRKMPAKWNDGHSTKPQHGQCLPSPLPTATMTPTINWFKTPATGSSSPRPPTWTGSLATSMQCVASAQLPKKARTIGYLCKTCPSTKWSYSDMQQTTHPDQLTSVCPPVFIMRAAAGSCSNQDPIKR